MSKNLKEIAIANCSKQPHQIDYVLEDAPLLARIPFVPTSNGILHFFEKVHEVGAADFVNLDGALPVADVDTEIDSRTLGVMGFKIRGAVDTVRLTTKGGTFDQYLARKAPKVMKASGAAMETKIARLAKVYNTRNNQLINAGGSGTATYSIFAFRFVEDEMCGLYDPDGFGKGALFDTQMLSGGKLYEDKDGKDVYGAAFRCYIDFMMENPLCSAAIVNITSDKPVTSEMVDKLLKKVRAGKGGTTVIVGHPEAIEFINKLKNPFSTQSESITTKVTTYNGVPVIEDWNFPGQENAMTSLTDTSTSKLTLSGKDTVVDDARFFTAKAVTAGGSIESDEINLGKGGVLSSIGVKVVANTAITGVGEEAALTIEIQHRSATNQSFETLHSLELTAAAAAGDVLLDYVMPSNFKGYAKIKITAAAGIAGSVDAYGLLIR